MCLEQIARGKTGMSAMEMEFGLCSVLLLGETGCWDALLETSVDLGLTGDWQHRIDSTIIRAHSEAAGTKGDV